MADTRRTGGLKMYMKQQERFWTLGAGVQAYRLATLLAAVGSC